MELYNQRIKKEEMAALYSIADCALVAPLRAGMDTDVHDYVTCRGSGGDEEDAGVVVVRFYTIQSFDIMFTIIHRYLNSLVRQGVFAGL